MTDGFIVVRSGTERYGLPLAEVEEVLDLPTPDPVPGRTPSFRGVAPWRGRHVSVLHLGALVGGGAPPEGVGPTAVVARLGGRAVALEVDELAEVVEDESAATLGGDAGNVRVVEGRLVTVLDLGALAERLEEQGEGQ